MKVSELKESLSKWPDDFEVLIYLYGTSHQIDYCGDGYLKLAAGIPRFLMSELKQIGLMTKDTGQSWDEAVEARKVVKESQRTTYVRLSKFGRFIFMVKWHLKGFAQKRGWRK